MRLEDRCVPGEQERLDREDVAEARRMQREASNAFASRASNAAARHERATVLSARRQDRVALARAIVAALGTDGYDSFSYPIGGTR